MSRKINGLLLTGLLAVSIVLPVCAINVQEKQEKPKIEQVIVAQAKQLCIEAKSIVVGASKVVVRVATVIGTVAVCGYLIGGLQQGSNGSEKDLNDLNDLGDTPEIIAERNRFIQLFEDWQKDDNPDTKKRKQRALERAYHPDKHHGAEVKVRCNAYFHCITNEKARRGDRRPPQSQDLRDN